MVGDGAGDGELDGDTDGLGEADGSGEVLGLGETDGLGESEGDGLTLTEGLGDGEVSARTTGALIWPPTKMVINKADMYLLCFTSDLPLDELMRAGFPA